MRASQGGGITCSRDTQGVVSISGTPGPWLILYTYDALGRLIRAQRPWPQPSSSPEYFRIEHHYYDGVRRVQELFVDPVIASETDKGKASQDEAEDAPLIASLNLAYINREYIWGPDYIDELVCQIAPSGGSMGSGEYILYALTGHAGTISTLLDTGGYIHAQYNWDPYGELLASDINPEIPRNRIGHQGLFFDRLTGLVDDP